MVENESRDRTADGDVHPCIAEAIIAGAKAGACWAALRDGHRPNAPWRAIGAVHSRAARAHLANVVSK